MAYREFPESDQEVIPFLRDIAERKEFAWTAKRDAPVSVMRAEAEGLSLQGAQMFVRNFEDPVTPYNRLLLKWQTGTGKTIGMISIALAFLRAERARAAQREAAQHVFFIASPGVQQIIQVELLRHPEFGFVSREEITELNRLRALARGSTTSPEALQFRGYWGSLVRRLREFRFFGYEMFANRLFRVTVKGSREKIDIARLLGKRADAEPDVVPDAASDTILSELDSYIRRGLIEVNQALLDEMGLLAVDEIQNVYNVRRQNNYGAAIQYALQRRPDVRAVFASATPMTGSATELTELLNLLGGEQLTRADLFKRVSTHGVQPGTQYTLKKSAMRKYRDRVAGRVSVVLDSDTKSYPRRELAGAIAKTPEFPDGLPYLRFVECAISPLQEKALESWAAQQGVLRDTPRGTPQSTSHGTPHSALRIPMADRGLYDMVYPNPGGGDPLYGRNVYQILDAAPQTWKEKMGVITADRRIRGPFLAGSSLKKYSAKYAEMIRLVLEQIRAGPGKIMIYHHWVTGTGVLQVEEILRANGILDLIAPPNDNTICAICGKARAKHAQPSARGAKRETSRAPSHNFKAARFVSVNYQVDPGAINRGIQDFNSADNLDGYNIRILLASKIIAVGYTIKAVNLQIILSMPTDIANYIQVIGRVVRKGSHADLPPDRQYAKIETLVSARSAEGAVRSADHAFEVLRYSDKMRNYLEIQVADRWLNELAADSAINFPQIIRAYPQLDARGENRATLEALPYVPSAGVPRAGVPRAAHASQKPRVSTFDAYYGDEEQKILRGGIAALFRSQPVWTREQIIENLDAVVDVDMALVSSGAVDLALERASDPTTLSEPRLSKVGEYYIAGVVDYGAFSREHEHSAREQSMIEIDVNRFAERSRGDKNFEVRLRAFEKKYARYAKDPQAMLEMLAEYDENFHYRLLETILRSRKKAGRTLSPPIAAAKELYERFRILVEGRGGAVGYLKSNAVALYDPVTDSFTEAPREKYGYGYRQKENAVAVGYVERARVTQGVAKGPLRFKIRPPTQTLEKERVRDIRSLARGAVCETRTREEQSCLAAKLKAMTPSQARLRSSSGICREIYLKLLANEERARNGSNNAMQSAPRWFYLFNDPRPVIQLVKGGSPPGDALLDDTLSSSEPHSCAFCE